MKFGVTSYSFDAYLNSGKKNIYELPAYARSLGFEGIEFAGLMEFDEPVDQALLKEKCREAGIAVCGYCTTADFAQDMAEQEAWVKSEIDRAAVLGAPVMRTDLYHGEPHDPYTPALIEAIRRLARYAAGRGVVLTTENHCGYFCRSERMERLFQAVNDDNFGQLFDTGNFLDADENPCEAIVRLAGWIRHVHWKDFHFKSGEAFYPGEGWYVTRGGNYIRGAIPGHGNAPLYPLAKALTQLGYDGYLVLEFEGIEDVEMAMRLGLSNMRQTVDRVKLGLWPGET